MEIFHAGSRKKGDRHGLGTLNRYSVKALHRGRHAIPPPF
jgi:hypothetical protein